MLCKSFPPAIDEECRYLILGSMPGITSLEATEYYAHPRNRFWPMISFLLEKKEPPQAYNERIAMLLRHHVALWDSIACCKRVGSLDSAIEDLIPNKISELLKAYPSIHTIICNGGKSYQIFKKYHPILCKDPHRKILALPSTSPANARWTLEKLIEAWGIAFEHKSKF